jgi:hypothetical protein
LSSVGRANFVTTGAIDPKLFTYVPLGKSNQIRDPGSGATVAPPLDCHSQGLSSAPGAAQLSGRPSAFGPPVYVPPPAPAPFEVAPPFGPVNRSIRVPLGAGMEFLGLGALAPTRDLACPPAPEISMFTDASLYGWGAHVGKGDLSAKGTWTGTDSLVSPSMFWR